MTISAKIIADSITDSPFGIRITTYELEYPRFVHAEFLTHRMFSRNAASSRAIPVKSAIELILADTARPIHWGKNQPGMSAKEECNELIKMEHHSLSGMLSLSREEAWDLARDRVIEVANAFSAAGYHKQIVNRLTEPFAHIKVVLTVTEDDNWFWLRNHVDAQPEIHALAQKMLAVKDASTPVVLKEGWWHTPYYGDGYWRDSGHARVVDGKLEAVDHKYPGAHSLKEALAISSSCCAQVSYRKNDESLEKAMSIFARLVESEPVHASPFEHQATPIPMQESLPKGVTHMRFSDQSLWSANFKGWIQHRQLIPNHSCENYTP